MISDWVKLARVPNAIVAGVGVWLGHACMGRIHWLAASSSLAASYGFISIVLLAAAANMQNDALDLEADRINRPLRPLPLGRLQQKTVFRVSIIGYLLAIGFAGLISLAFAALAAAMALLLCIYNFKLKSLPLWGNLTVAALCGLAIYFPEFPNFPWHTGLPILFAFLTTLTREIAKDAEDIVGDQFVGWKTFPILFGISSTRNLLRALLTLTILLLPLPYFISHYHFVYLIIIFTVTVPLLIRLWRILRFAAPDWPQFQKQCKWMMLTGIVALFAGVILKV